MRVLTASTRRRGQPARATSVESALAEVVQHLRRLRDRHGGASIGVLGSARVTVEEALLLRRLSNALRTPHLDTLQRIGYVPFPAVELQAIESAKRITVLGANLTLRQPQAGRRVLRAIDRGVHVRFVHARRVQLATLGAQHDMLLPGHELDALGEVGSDELVLLSSEIALSGQGTEAIRRLEGHRALFLTDYANQRGVVEAGLHPAPEGLAAWEMLQAAAEGGLKALLVFADDPFEFFPALAARAFERTELTVVVDAVKTPTTREADVVLPGALLTEKHGRVVNTEGRVQEIVPISPPLARWTEGAIASYLIDRLEPEAELAAVSMYHPGAGGCPAETPDEQYPFIVALDTTLFWNTHALIAATVTAWREARNLFADFPPGCATLNPDDARALGVAYGAPVTIASRDGSVTLPARHHWRMPPGTVWIAMPGWERFGSRLGALDFDPGLRIPVFRPRAVRLARAEAR